MKNPILKTIYPLLFLGTLLSCSSKKYDEFFLYHEEKWNTLRKLLEQEYVPQLKQKGSIFIDDSQSENADNLQVIRKYMRQLRVALIKITQERCTEKTSSYKINFGCFAQKGQEASYIYDDCSDEFIVFESYTVKHYTIKGKWSYYEEQIWDWSLF